MNAEGKAVKKEEVAGRHPGLLVGDGCCSSFYAQEDVFDADALLRAAKAARAARYAIGASIPKIVVENIKYASSTVHHDERDRREGGTDSQ